MAEDDPEVGELVERAGVDDPHRVHRGLVAEAEARPGHRPSRSRGRLQHVPVRKGRVEVDRHLERRSPFEDREVAGVVEVGAPMCEWMFPPLNPSSRTQRSSSSAAVCGADTGRLASPTNRVGWSAMNAARASFALPACSTWTSASNCSNPGLETLRNWIAIPTRSIASMRAVLRSSSMSRNRWLCVSITSGSDGSSQTRTFSSVTSKRGGTDRLEQCHVPGVKKCDSRSIFRIPLMAVEASLLRSVSRTTIPWARA